MKKEKQKLKAITLPQLTEWIEKNKHVTWDWNSKVHFTEERRNKPGYMRGKYFYFSLDTRDMEIFYLSLNGCGQDIEFSDKDEGEGTLLDALDRILAKDI